jgi:hypothetical protein
MKFRYELTRSLHPAAFRSRLNRAGKSTTLTTLGMAGRGSAVRTITSIVARLPCVSTSGSMGCEKGGWKLKIWRLVSLLLMRTA